MCSLFGCCDRVILENIVGLFGVLMGVYLLHFVVGCGGFVGK